MDRRSLLKSIGIGIVTPVLAKLIPTTLPSAPVEELIVDTAPTMGVTDCSSLATALQRVYSPEWFVLFERQTSPFADPLGYDDDLTARGNRPFIYLHKRP